MNSLSIGGGLNNLGNTCFFNATLQSILHTPPFSLILSSKSHSKSCNFHKNNKWCVFCQMQNVFHNTRITKSYSPNTMIHNIKSIFKKFKLGRQEDSHQFLRYLIEGMQETETGKLGKERQQNQNKIKTTKIFDTFGGIIKTCVQCLNCHHKSITTQRYYDFNIQCQRSNSLIQGINSFFAVDKLEGANKYLCQHCKQRCNARKRFILDSIPKIATFQLKRFTNNLRKIGKFIQYPLTLDIGKHLQLPHKALMKLYAVIVHAGGSSSSGHYYSYIRVGSNWYNMNDNYVSKCNQQTAMGQNAYILFYQKIIQQNGKQTIIKAHSQQKQQQLSKIHNQTKQTEIIPQYKIQKQIKLNKQDKKQEEIKVPKVIISQDKQQNKNQHQNSYSQPKNSIQFQQRMQTPKKSQNITDKIAQVLEYSNSYRQFMKSPQNKKLVNKIFQQINLLTTHPIIQQVTPNKNTQQILPPSKLSQQDNEKQTQQNIQLPGLTRRKSKQQMQQQLPYSQLVVRTLEKILEIEAKMPITRPRNNTQRQLYNLRKYQTVMQKKRKLG